MAMIHLYELVGQLPSIGDRHWPTAFGLIGSSMIEPSARPDYRMT